jgi:ribosomal protein L11 methylase PrmA
MRTWPAIDVHRLREPDLLQAALTDLDVVAVDERSDEMWRVFFGSTASRDRALELLRQDFPASDFTTVDVDDEDWAARSQSALRAVRIGNFIVAPPWDVPSRAAIPGRGTNGAPHVVVIQPSMGFGTGHHATTRLCLAALQQFDSARQHRPRRRHRLGCPGHRREAARRCPCHRHRRRPGCRAVGA